MRDLSSDLLYVVVLAVVFFGQYLLQWLRKYQKLRQAEPAIESQPAAQETVTDEGTADQTRPLSLLASELLEELSPDPGPPPPARPPPHDHPRRVRRYSREALLGNKRRTQDAVVASVILGPPRGL